MNNQDENLKTFRLHWLDGTTQDIKGTDIDNAMKQAGFIGGSTGALDYWEELKE